MSKSLARVIAALNEDAAGASAPTVYLSPAVGAEAPLGQCQKGHCMILWDLKSNFRQIDVVPPARQAFTP